MVDLTSTKNSDQELLKNVVSKDSYIIGEPRRSATEDSISKNTIRKVFGLWTDTVCAPPKIGLYYSFFFLLFFFAVDCCSHNIFIV